MGDFRKNNEKRFGSHGGGFGRREFGGNRDRGPVTMHQAICDQCKKPCEVPFRPTGDRPVYCNTCFEGKEDKGGDRFPSRSYSGYQAPAKPDFGANTGKGNNDELKKQLEILNAKMDRLINALEVMAKIKPSAVEEKAKETAKKALVTKVKKSVK